MKTITLVGPVVIGESEGGFSAPAIEINGADLGAALFEAFEIEGYGGSRGYSLVDDACKFDSVPLGRVKITIEPIGDE